METGWRHNDPETRKEFERLRRPTSSQSTTEGADFELERRGATGPIGDTGDSRAYDVISSQGTITVGKTLAGDVTVFDLHRPLTLLHEGEPVVVRPTAVDTVNSIDFQDTASVIWTLSADPVIRDRVIVTAVAAGAGTYSWYVAAADTPGSDEIINAETVTFDGINGVTVTRVGNTITTDRPLTIEDDNVAVGGADTITLNFDSNGQTATAIAVNFVVTDNGSGQRSVRAFVPNMYDFFSYSWWVADSDEQLNVPDSGVVTFLGTDGVVVELDTGLATMTISRPLTIEDDDVAVGGTDTIFINFDSNGQTTTAVPVNFVVTDDGAGQRTIAAYVPASSTGTMSTWYIGINAETPGEAVTDSELVRIVQGNFIEVTRSVQDITITNTGYWVLRTNSDVTTDFQIAMGGVANFVGRNKVKVSQIDETVIIDASGENGGRYGGRWLAGRIILPTATTPTVGYYGEKVTADIVHGWNLSNMHRFDLELRDEIYDNTRNGGPDVAINHRGSAYPTGLGVKAGPIIEASIPFVSALDADTIRIYATIAHLNGATGGDAPTDIYYYFVLHEVPTQT